mgnify:CR=1 FL=1
MTIWKEKKKTFFSDSYTMNQILTQFSNQFEKESLTFIQDWTLKKNELKI